MSIITKIKNRLKWLISFPRSWVEKIIYPMPQIATIEETVKEIINNNCSVSRYGDGELNIMLENAIDFQPTNTVLAEKMKHILLTEDSRFLVCLTDSISGYCGENKETRTWWNRFMRTHRKDWWKLLKKDKKYYNTCITRFYLRYKDKSKVPSNVKLLKQIWDNRDIVFIEGEKSRLGVGNDLFDNANSIKRILCPAEGAFSVYDQIISTVENQIDKSALILIALGPTATAMAYDLYKKGYQAIDIGHIDIEYEWYLLGAKSKVAVKGKYTNETSDGKSVSEINDEKYLKEIFTKIGV